MRRLRVVVSMALIAILATVAVPGPVGSRAFSPEATLDPSLFERVEAWALVRGTTMTIQPQDPGARSAGHLDDSSILIEPAPRTGSFEVQFRAAQPVPAAGSARKNVWRMDWNISWYGPGFYGNRTACGLTLTRTLVGVAHRTLPCGTKVLFRNPANGRTVVATVVDRGPYVTGRIWDLTKGACMALGHCYTGTVQWKFVSGG